MALDGLARPRAFDEAAVLDVAIRCFWARSYDGTSVRDLSSAMGINGASLSNAFGDKQALCRRSLDHDLRHSVHDRTGRLTVLPPRDAVRAVLDGAAGMVVALLDGMRA